MLNLLHIFTLLTSVEDIIIITHLFDLSQQTCKLKESSEALSIECPPFLRQDSQAFQLAEQLLSSVNVTLRKDTDTLRVETGSNGGDHLLVLCLSIHGLSLLSKGLN